MRSRLITFAALLLVASTLVTSTEAVCAQSGKKCSKDSPCCKDGWCDSKPLFCAVNCQPENSYDDHSCYPPPGCTNFESSFGDSGKLVALDKWDANPNTHDFYSEFSPNYAAISGGQLELDLKYDGSKKNDAGNYGGFGATVTWTRMMLYGKATATIKTASLSPGVVSSFITKSPEGDEIDFEWVGKDPTEVQSNYYVNNELDYTKGKHHSVGADTSQDFHTYAIDWSPDTLNWWIDGKIVRTLNKADTKQADGSFKYPKTLSHVQFSVWDGGSQAPGTANWAGTPTNWSDKNKAYPMFVKNIKIECQNPVQNTTWPPPGYGPKKASGSGSSGSGSGSDNGSTSDLASALYTASTALAAAVASVFALF